MKKRKSVLSWPVSLWIVVNYLIGYANIYPWIVDLICDSFVMSALMQDIIRTMVYVFVFLTTVISAWPLLRYGWEKLTDSFGTCMGHIIRTQIGMIVFMAVMSFIRSKLGLSTSRNQRGINNLVQKHRFYYTVMAVIFAPFVEELVFRGAIFNSFRAKGNKTAGYVVSSFLFGLIHVLSSLLAGDFADCLFIFLYAGMGLALSYVYDRTDSVFCSILLHMLNNAISLLGV